MSSPDKPVPPGGLVMLREEKLASRCVTGTRNGEFSNSAIHFANTLAGKHTEHVEMTGSKISNLLDQCKYTHPVAWRACRCARFGDWVTVCLLYHSDAAEAHHRVSLGVATITLNRTTG